MSQFIETMRLQDGELRNLPYHQSRFIWTRTEVLGLKNHPRLASEIPIPDGLDRGLFKCRVLYGKEIELIEFEPYDPPVITSLKLVSSGSISYGYKYSDRSQLTALYKKRGDCDDILIVKQDCITDTTYANVALFDGSNWYTPDTPLLPGTMRASLLESGSLMEVRIMVGDLVNFQKIRMINALNNLDEGPEMNINHIRY